MMANNKKGSTKNNKKTTEKKKNLDIDKKEEEKLEAKTKKDSEKEIAKADEEKLLEKNNKKEIKMPEKKNSLLSFLLICTLIGSIAYFISILLNFDGVSDIIKAILLLCFTIAFIGVISTNPSKKKTTSIMAVLLLFMYQVFLSLVLFNVIKLPTIKMVEDFSNKELTYVVKWASKNKITLNQIYEYSDLTEEYFIINQDVEAGTKVDKVKELTVVVSEGVNPYKEIVVPSMLGWDDERVIKFIKDNHLSNVIVGFVKSEKAVNTVIEQSKSGNLARNEEIKLTFSYGEERENSEVNLKDLTNMSQFDCEFYLKQNGIKYQINYDFSSDIKRGFVISQSIKPSSMVSIEGTNELQKTLIVTISKGPKIKVPDLTKYSLEEITAWVIENKLKISFLDRYDDGSKEGDILEVSHKEGDEVEQGSVITVTLSKGKLKMTKFDSLNSFKEWADKYEIKYEEQYEFSDTVGIGEVIRYSYSNGDTIKNGDTVTVVISNGKKIVVPNVIGISEAACRSKLTNAGLNVNFVYRYSDSPKGNSILQSISSGSEVSQGTTVTVTLSKGPKPVDTPSTPSGPTTPPAPTCDRSKKGIFYINPGGTGAQTLSATKAGNPNFTIKANFVDSCSNGDAVSGTVCNAMQYDAKELSFCDEINLTIVK